MNKIKRTTIYDISQRSGYSVATVSRVLNGSTYPVKAETRENIQKIAKEMHYVPNSFGKILKTQQNRDIGIIVPNLSNSYYPTLLQGIYDYTLSAGYNPILYNSYRRPELEEKNIQLLMQKQAQGFIIASINPDSSIIQNAVNYGYRIVTIEQDIPVQCTKILFNFKAGAYKATQCLLDHGHRAIGFIGAPLNRTSRIEMLKGYQECLENAGLEIRSDYIRLGNREEDQEEIYEFENGIRMAKCFAKMKDRPTGYVCLNDMTALGAIKGFSASGLQVPQDVSVIGFDNIPFAKMSTPELTTVDQCIYGMGTMAAQFLIDNIQDPTKPQVSITLEPTIILRNSVRSL